MDRAAVSDTTMKTSREPAAERFVRYGAFFYVLGAVQFVIGMIVVALYYGPPRYDIQRNSISDLQAVNCGIFQGSQVCSPLHLIANSSVTLLGLLLVLGTLLIHTRFPAGRIQTMALGLLVVGGLGAAANGFTPEDVTLLGDTLTALLAFLGANFGLVQIGRLMARDPGWSNFRLYTEISGVVGFVALILYGTDITGPLGPGGMEWLIVVPVTVWAFVVGIHLIRTSANKERSAVRLGS
ncbi:MAG: DUF998 domain-containing protein [Thaumarchaeota archaeon]|nr:DUF998 domain-containing protein [Nitrososphaerota archaeon]